MPIDSQEGPPKTEVPAEAFSELREQSHTQIGTVAKLPNLSP